MLIECTNVIVYISKALQKSVCMGRGELIWKGRGELDGKGESIVK